MIFSEPLGWRIFLCADDRCSDVARGRGALSPPSLSSVPSPACHNWALRKPMSSTSRSNGCTATWAGLMRSLFFVRRISQEKDAYGGRNSDVDGVVNAELIFRTEATILTTPEVPRMQANDSMSAVKDRAAPARGPNKGNTLLWTPCAF